MPQVLVKWSGMHPSLATWEDFDAIKQRFPRASAWGQAGFHREGSVSNTVDMAPNIEPEGGIQDDGPRKSTRPRKSNSKYDGPDWVQPV